MRIPFCLLKNSGALVFLLSTCILSTQVLAAKDNVQKNGDILQFAIPLLSLGSTLVFEDDFEGSKQFLKAFAASELTTLALKKLTHERRPSGSCCDSFPSGHTSAAFMGASFIHYRYGWKYSIPAYVAAAYVGYSRVHSNQHYTRDVVAGAAVGIISSYFFTKKYHGFSVTPYTYAGGVGLQLNTQF
ncbi:MAG: phosphatase PAP2 family protein [Alteromonadaceae bacterium]|nr:phosphatase PAP2 family protein [Alteromonadaceae bacterium]